MPAQNILLPPGTLWNKVTKRTKHALQCGALQSIPTTYELVEQSGISFLVRMLVNLIHKEEAKKRQEEESDGAGKRGNPFLPYEEDLFVADLSETHLCLLNKFNAVDYHLLIITRAYEEQERLLNAQDFVATWVCLDEINGLVFYNGGQKAGASQRHKHLQLIPLPLIPKGPAIPIEPVLASAHFQGAIGTVLVFPFRHAIARLTFPPSAPLPYRVEKTLESYQSLLKAVDLLDDTTLSIGWQQGPYNLLMTREWMLLVPRSQERFEAIAVNSLGFAGALLVRNQEQMAFLKEIGPITVLKGVAIPRQGS
ncbi:ATP adenylyltransferase family protein [Leptothermofonsia sp. ETS-13]|uniref:ATP adenylyltransferase family protein n=1 Tax=Leptothermofonsia sp. ETS-13 TaxID=3035696 RepID=UPI003B9FF8DE